MGGSRNPIQIGQCQIEMRSLNYSEQSLLFKLSTNCIALLDKTNIQNIWPSLE